VVSPPAATGQPADSDESATTDQPTGSEPATVELPGPPQGPAGTGQQGSSTSRTRFSAASR